MNCPNCNGTISQHDRFCRHCGKPVVASPPPASVFRPHREGIRFPIELNDFGPPEILAAYSGETWGAHIYTGHSQESNEIKARPEDCPEWVQSNDWQCWFRRGLAVWDHATQHIGTLLAGEAIELLKNLESSDEWKIQGIAIIERHKNWLSLDETPRPKRSRKKKDVEPEPAPEEPKSKSKFYEQERVRLTGPAAQEFYEYLCANKVQIKRMADEEDVLQQQADKYLFKIQMKFLHDIEISKFDGIDRKFPWTRHEYPLTFVCDLPPDRGTITLSEDGFWWIPVIEQPGHFKYDYERFISLEKAVAWVEQKIPELRAQDEEWQKNWDREQAEEEAQIAALPRKDLSR